jgi:hypothetical protein
MGSAMLQAHDMTLAASANPFQPSFDTHPACSDPTLCAAHMQVIATGPVGRNNQTTPVQRLQFTLR